MDSQVSNWGSSLMASLTSAMSLFFAAIPRVIGFAVIIIVGWVLSALLAQGIKSYHQHDQPDKPFRDRCDHP